MWLKISNIVANCLLWFLLMAIGVGIWIDIIRSGVLTPELVGKIISEAVR